MNNEPSTPEIPSDDGDLDLFSAEFFGTGKPKEEIVEEKVEGNQEDTPAPDTEKEPETKADDEPEQDDPDNEEVDSEEESKFKVKTKLTARERVEQLNAKYREEERLRIAAEARITEIERKLQLQEQPKVEVQEDQGPSHDAKLEDGTDKYPLGEYDPDYIRDLHKHEAQKARIEMAREFQQQQEAQRNAALAQEIAAEWNGKVETSIERLPDLQEKALQLEANLAGTDPAIVDSLAMTIMSLDNGPDVLYYLSEHVEEARAIAKGGPQALLALGKLDARLTPTVKQNKEPVKVSDAPEPPPSRSRGIQGKFTVSPDTDDLDAFSDTFFKRA